MRTSPLVRLFVLLLAVTAVAAACSSSSSADTAGSESADAGTETGSDDADDSAELPDIDVDAPVNPEDVRELAANLTGAEVTGDQVTCMVSNTDGDTQLTAVYNGFRDQNFQLTPEGFTALTVNLHDCMNSVELAVSLIGLTGSGDETGEYVTCVDGYLADDVNGDLAYTGLAALLVGFPVPEGAQEAATSAATECIGANSLTNQLAASREQLSGFVEEVDRDCLAAQMTDELVSEFWTGAVTGNVTTDQFDPLVTECASVYDSGLADEVPADFEPFAASGLLAEVDPSVRNGLYTEAPENMLEEGVDYQARLTTDDGVILIDLYEDTAPITVNSFVALARDGFYDQTNFHRVLDGFMAQGGDPSNTGSGGPGYTFDDEESGLTPVDSRGLLAMANSGADTNGSQFFITLDAAEWLDGLHTVFGEVVEGDDVLGQIELRDPAQPMSRGEQLISVEIIEG